MTEVAITMLKEDSEDFISSDFRKINYLNDQNTLNKFKLINNSKKYKIIEGNYEMIWNIETRFFLLYILLLRQENNSTINLA